MRILQIVHSFPPYNQAGTEVYTYNLAKQLSQKHTVSVFHRINNARIKEYDLSKTKMNGFATFALNNTFRDCRSFEMTYKNDEIDKKFCEVLDIIQPDILHIQHLLFLSIGIVTEARQRNIPIVFTVHDYWLICHATQLLKRDGQICDLSDFAQCCDCLKYQLAIKGGVINLYDICKEIMPGLLLQFAKQAYLRFAKRTFLSLESSAFFTRRRSNQVKEMTKSIDLFIAPSYFIKDKIVDSGITADRVEVSTYGFNKYCLQNTEKTASNKIRFGFIGSIIPAKGLHVLIESFSQLNSTQIELKIYGALQTYKGFEDYLRSIKKMAIKSEDITFMGKFDPQQTGKVFSGIDVLVVPSVWYENSPLVIHEAFLSRTPVIAARIGGIPELIKDGVNGFLFESRDVEDLKQKMISLIRHPEMMEIMSENAPAVKDIEQNANELEGIYSKLVNGRLNSNCVVRT